MNIIIAFLHTFCYSHNNPSSDKPFGSYESFHRHTNTGYVSRYQNSRYESKDKFDTNKVNFNIINEQELSNIIYAHGKLNQQMSKNLYRAWEEQTLLHIKEFNEQPLSNIIYAHGMLNQQMSMNLYKAWEEQTLLHIKGFNEQGLSNIIYAHGKLNKQMSMDLYTTWEEQAVLHIKEFSEGLSNIIHAHRMLNRSIEENLRKVLESINVL